MISEIYFNSFSGRDEDIPSFVVQDFLNLAAGVCNERLYKRRESETSMSDENEPQNIDSNKVCAGRFHE